MQRSDVNQLGHAQEIKIQNGGLLGLQSQLITEENIKVEDIDALIADAEKVFKDSEDFPYSTIMQVISAYRIRPKRIRTKKD